MAGGQLVADGPVAVLRTEEQGEEYRQHQADEHGVDKEDSVQGEFSLVFQIGLEGLPGPGGGAQQQGHPEQDALSQTEQIGGQQISHENHLPPG